MEEKLIGGKYKIIRELGKGGQGNVYLAEDVRVGKIWALKEFTKVDKVWQEIEPLKYVKHRNLPLFIDMVKEEDRACLVMEYIDGSTLEEILQEKKNLPKQECIRIALEILEALKCLHNQTPSIVFGDLKPSNVMIDREGNVKLIDFGTAIRGGRQRETYGTKGYAAPEQVAKNLYAPEIDKRTDFYSFGILLYKMLTGELLFDKDGMKKMSHPNLNQRLKQIILTCTAFDKDKRYETAERLSDDLRKLAAWERRRRRQYTAANAVFAGLFFICVLCFVLQFYFTEAFLYPAFVCWVFSFLWYKQVCQKKEEFYQGDGIRILLSAKKIPGLIIFICFITCYLLLQSVIVPRVQAKTANPVAAEEVERDEYGRKILVRTK